jgi:heptosyltransferase-2
VKPTVARFVVFAPNWLGDAVMALPAIAGLRRALPDVSLTMAARPAIAPLFSMVPGIDGVAVLEKRGRESFSWSSKRGRESFSPEGHEKDSRPLFDTAILLPNSFHVALTAWRAGVPERWGYRTDWRRPLLTRAIDPPVGVHQVDYYQHLVRALGLLDPSPFPAQPHIVISEELRAIGVKELTGAGWDGTRPLVVLAPGAAYGSAKRWPPASFAELARALASDGIQSVMVGGRADLPVAREIEAALGVPSAAPGAPRDGEAVLNLMGTDLPTLAGILSACRALVSNDSGAMHLGAAIGVRVTAVFGPTNERLTRPAGDGHIVLTSPVWCRPCMMRECPIDHRCMRGVGVDRVVGAVRQML